MTRNTRLWAAIVLAAVFALIGHVIFKGGNKTDSGENPETEAASDTPFALVGAALGELDGRPALALSFSQPLDTRLNYDPLARVFKLPSDPKEKKKGAAKSEVSDSDEMTRLDNGTPVKGAWVVGENPRMLYFPHIEPRTRYVVQVADTLKAKDGQTLGKETRYSITTTAVLPAYFFASKGMVLPTGENGGLPVVTVNVPEVDVQFLRVRPEQIPRFFDLVLTRRNTSQAQNNEESEENEEGEGDEEDRGYNPFGYEDASLQGAVYYWKLDYLRNMTESVYQGRFLTEKTPNKRSVTYLPVESIKELKEPGVYIAVMSQPGRFRGEAQTTYYYVSDLGLHLRQFEQVSEVFVNSLKDGNSVPDVDLTWLDRAGKVLAHGKTNSDGHATFAKKPADAVLLVARKGLQITLISAHETALDLSEFDVTGQDYKPVRLFAWSGRNLYRPGETFTLSALARDDDGRPVPPQPVQATLYRADGRKQFVSMWQPMAGQSGYYQQKISLPGDAPTGIWTLELRNDPSGKQANTSLRFYVEEFLPERMQLDLTAPSKPLAPNETLRINAAGKYLYGSPAAGNRLLGVAEIERNKNPLSAAFPGFVFGDVADDSLRTRWELKEEELDDKGNAVIDISTENAKKAKSPVTVRATFSLLETGGRPVVREINRTIWPAPVLTAVRPLYTGNYAPVNSPVDFEVIRVSENASLKPEKGLQARLFNEKRDYYWRFEDQRGWHSGYTETDELAYSVTLDIPASGRARLRAPVRYGHYRLEIFDPATGLTQRYRFDAGWWSESQDDQRPDRVTLKFDRDAYREGETAKLTITPPHTGVAIVTVDGDRILWTKRVQIDGASTVLNIPIDKSWKRHDLYVSVMALRPGGKGDNVTPTRALGLIHLPLVRTERKIDVAIEAPERVKPETTISVKVKAPSVKGKKALLTVSAVDVGILNITQFPVPDPFGFFFDKLHYGADLRDIYGRLIEKMPGKKGTLKWGGDASLEALKKMPKKVKLVDLFNGPVAFDENGEADIPLDLPDFNGTLRLFAVVADADRFGSQSRDMIVAAPVIAELSTPRYLNFNDRSTFALDLQNLTEKTGTFKIEIKAESGLVIRNAKREATLKPQQKTTLRYNVEAGEEKGLHTLNLSVQGSGIRLERQYALEVEAATPTRQQTLRYVIEPGATLTIREPSLKGLYPGTLAAHLFVSSKPPVDIRSAIQWLLQYPYGCAEQTTSSAYPWLFVDEAAAKRYDLKAYTRKEREERLNFALGRLAGYQSLHGSFSLWGNAEKDLWLSAYIAGFLQDAREQGFTVPDALYNKTMDYLLRTLQENSAQILPFPKTALTPNELLQLMSEVSRNQRNFAALAKTSYVLARERKAPLSALRLLFEARHYAESGLPLIELGIALSLMGDNPRGKEAIEEGIKKERVQKYLWWDYGSDLRDLARSYVLLKRNAIQSPNLGQLLARIQSAVSTHNPEYFSTQERLALFQLGQTLGAEPEKPWQAEIENGGKKRMVSDKTSSFVDMTAAEITRGFSLANPNDHPLFVELSMSGNSVQMPPQPKPGEPRFTLEREYLRADGSPVGAGALSTGDTVLVHLRAAAANTATSTAIVIDRIPAGLEIENANLARHETPLEVKGIQVAEAMQSDRIQRVEFRDDRFVAAVKLGGKDVHLFYRARVVTPGQYVIPPVYAEDMYRPYVYGILGTDAKMTIADRDGLAVEPAQKPEAETHNANPSPPGTGVVEPLNTGEDAH